MSCGILVGLFVLLDGGRGKRRGGGGAKLVFVVCELISTWCLADIGTCAMVAGLFGPEIACELAVKKEIIRWAAPLGA
jgi:hypothetical protein